MERNGYNFFGKRFYIQVQSTLFDALAVFENLPLEIVVTGIQEMVAVPHFNQAVISAEQSAGDRL